MRRSSPLHARHLLSRLDRLRRDDGGFTLVEVMAAITVLAVGIFAAAQALTFGLSTTGLSRQRLAARSGLDQQMEEARALNYDNLVLSDPDPGLTHSTDPADPDYWVNTTNQTYDPDGSGPLSPETLVRVAGASPALQHYQNPFVVGSTTYAVYRYVTWVDSPTDGCVSVTSQCSSATSDASDGNNDGNETVSDANGHDMKRVTVVVTWTDEFGRTPVSQSQSSLFTDGKIVYKAPTLNSPPAVSCPSVTAINDKTVTFAGVASDSDGTIASISWTFKSGSTTLGTATGSTTTFTFPGYATYSVANTVVDNGGGSATNSSLNCTVTTVDPSGGNGGPNAGTIKIANDASYTNTSIVTLKITKGSGTTPAYMAFSNDGTTWAPQVSFSTSASWTLLTGDGTKTVYARFYDSSGLYSALMSDTIILDTTPPGAPTVLHVASSSTSGSNKTLSLAWTAPTGVTDLGGYRLYRRIITSTGAYSLVCDTSSTSCTDTHKKTESYEYYVIAYDLAGNQSAQSNHVTG
jgi:prepilin-type N-terminal cleavage/methylation domain-containing protein